MYKKYVSRSQNNQCYRFTAKHMFMNERAHTFHCFDPQKLIMLAKYYHL